MSDMRRREFISLLGGAATWSVTARAQQPAMPVVGFIHILSPENVPHFVPAFHQGLKEGGFVEGQNIAVEYRWAHGQYDRMAELAADLVSRQVAVIAALAGEPSPQIVAAATRTIPIVFASNGDPVREGLVASLNRPGGNATGVTIFGTAAVAKRMQLLHEVAPHATVIGFLMNPTNPNGNSEMEAARTAASSVGKELLVLRASSEGEIDAAFEIMVQRRDGAVRKVGQRGTLIRSLSCMLAARQAHRKDRTFARLARHGHVPVHHACELAGDGKAQPGAAKALSGRGIGVACEFAVSDTGIGMTAEQQAKQFFPTSFISARRYDTSDWQPVQMEPVIVAPGLKTPTLSVLPDGSGGRGISILNGGIPGARLIGPVWGPVKVTAVQLAPGSD